MRNRIVFQRTHSGVLIRVDDAPLRLADSLQVRRHSPTGFEVGYGGSGPAQSALAILLHVLGPRNVTPIWPGGDAERVYQDFKSAYIAKLPQDDLVALDVDVAAWADEALAGRNPGAL